MDEGTETQTRLLGEVLARMDDARRKGRLEESAGLGREILSYYPDHLEATLGVGQALLELGNAAEAEEWMLRGLAADPEHGPARAVLGRLYEAQGRLEEAIEQWQRAFDLAAGQAEARLELERLLAQRAGAAIAPLHLSRAGLGWTYARNGVHERAIEAFREALQQDPGRDDVRTALAESLWRLGRRLEALEAALDVVRRLPKCLKANLILGQLHASHGQTAEAEARLAVAHALDPQNRVAQQVLSSDSPLALDDAILPPPAEGEATPLAAALDTGSAGLPPSAEWQPVELPPWLEQPQPEGAAAAPGAMLLVGGALAAGDESPEWLEAWTAPAMEEQAVASPSADLPGWLAAIAPAAAARPAATAAAVAAAQMGEPEAPAAGAATEPDVANEGAPAVPAEEGERTRAAAGAPPDEATAAEEGGEAEPKPEGQAAVSAVAVAQAEGEVPDWVRKLEADVAAEAPPPGAAVAAVPRSEEERARRARMAKLEELLLARPRDARARIELARLCRLQGEPDAAVLHYEEIIAGRKLLPAVVEDLTAMLGEEADQVEVFRLLGDAYSDLGQEEQALEMYRQGRETLRARRR